MEKEEQRVITDLIKCYRLHPVLWDHMHKDYHNKLKRIDAYEELVKIFKRINPDATILDVRQKINCLRTNYKREKKRQNRKKQVVRDKPTLFYFDTISFLDPIFDNLEKKKGSDLNLLISDLSEIHNDEASETEFQSNFVDASMPVSSDTNEFNQSGPSEHELSVSLADREPSLLKNYDADEAEVYGRAWIMQFRNLSEDQKIFTKKAFEDILFEARLGTLHRHSIKINDSLCQNCQDNLINTEYIEVLDDKIDVDDN